MIGTTTELVALVKKGKILGTRQVHTYPLVCTSANIRQTHAPLNVGSPARIHEQVFCTTISPPPDSTYVVTAKSTNEIHLFLRFSKKLKNKKK